MKRLLFPYVLLFALGCNTFAEVDSVEEPDAGTTSDAGLVDGGAGEADAGPEDAGPEDAGGDGGDETDAGVEFIGEPVAVETSCDVSPEHVQIDSRESGEFDTNINLTHRLGENTLELNWVQADGQPRGTEVPFGVAVMPTLTNGDDLDMATRFGPEIADLAISEFDVANVSAGTIGYALAGHNCNSDNADFETRSAWYVDGMAYSADVGSCTVDPDRSMPNAWLPAIVGGVSGTGEANRAPIMTFFSQAGIQVLDPGSGATQGPELESRPGRNEWARGTAGDLVMFPNFSETVFYVWNPRTPDEPLLEVQTPGIDPLSIFAGRARIDFIYSGNDHYLFAFWAEDAIHIIEYEYRSATHELIPTRVIDEITTTGNDAADAVRLVRYEDGFAIFYLEADPESTSGGERWIIQPYRFDDEVERLGCPLIYDGFTDIQVLDIELVAVRGAGSLSVFAAVHFDLNGNSPQINVEGGFFGGLL